MLKEIRDHYGISQHDFAAMLKISRSQYSMVETGKRSLETKTLLSLLPLYHAISETGTNTPAKNLVPELLQQSVQLKKLRKNREERCVYKLQSLQQLYSKMKTEQARSIDILSALASLIVNEKDIDKILLTVLEGIARKVQIKTSEIHQLKLQLKIQSLEGQLKYLKQLNKEVE